MRGSGAIRTTPTTRLLENSRRRQQPLLGTVYGAAARDRRSSPVSRYLSELFLRDRDEVNAFCAARRVCRRLPRPDRDNFARRTLPRCSPTSCRRVTQGHIARAASRPSRPSIRRRDDHLGVPAASRSSNLALGNAVLSGRPARRSRPSSTSRDMEREADRVGLRRDDAGSATPAAWRRQMFESRPGPAPNDSGNYPYLRLHPLTVDRIHGARFREAPPRIAAERDRQLRCCTPRCRRRARALMDPRHESLRRPRARRSSRRRPATAPRPLAAWRREQPPDASVAGAAERRAERLARVYASASAATLLLRDWTTADVFASVVALRLRGRAAERPSGAARGAAAAGAIDARKR